MLKGISRLRFKYIPAQPASSSIQEFLNRCCSPKMRNKYPECEIVVRILNQGDPELEIDFKKPEVKKVLKTKDMKVKEIETSISDVIMGAAFKEALKAAWEKEDEEDRGDPENPGLIFEENKGLESFVAKKIPKAILRELEKDEPT